MLAPIMEPTSDSCGRQTAQLQLDDSGNTDFNFNIYVEQSKDDCRSSFVWQQQLFSSKSASLMPAYSKKALKLRFGPCPVLGCSETIRHEWSASDWNWASAVSSWGSVGTVAVALERAMSTGGGKANTQRLGRQRLLSMWSWPTQVDSVVLACSCDDVLIHYTGH